MESIDTNGRESTLIDVSTRAARVLLSDEKLKCDSCGYFTYNKYYLKQHISLVHSPERPFRCPFCDYAGKRSHSLKEHLIVHSTERPYRCNQCSATFRKKGHLTNHIKMHSSPTGSSSECRLCHTTFDQRNDLYGHLRTVHCLSSFHCSFCDYATTVKSNLIMHENGHADKNKIRIMAMKPKIPPGARVILKCTACGFETANERSFEAHMVAHAGAFLPGHTAGSAAKPQTDQGAAHLVSVPRGRCAECDFSSNDAYAFLTHVLSHKPTQAGPGQGGQGGTRSLFTQDALSSTFCCSICGYVCDSQRTIKAHVWKHSGHKQLEYPTFQTGSLSSRVVEPLATGLKDSPSETGCGVVPGQQTSRQPAAAIPAPTTAEPLAVSRERSVTPARDPDCLASEQRSLHKIAPITSRSMQPETRVETTCASSTLAVSDRQSLQPLSAEANRVRPAAVPTSAAASSGCCTTSDSARNSHSCLQVEQPRPVSAAEKEDSAITLLSLLKRGPNFNPACPSSATGSASAAAADLRPPTFQLLPPPSAKRAKLLECGKSSIDANCGAPSDTNSVAVAVADPCPSSSPKQNSSAKQQQGSRRGICSSLLAVIEQLRESSDSEVSSSSSGSCCRSSPPSSPRHATRATPATVGSCSSSSSDEETSARMVVLELLPNVERLDSGGYRCRLCHYTTSSSAAGTALLAQHMKTHRSRQPFGCTLCDHVAASSEALQAHVITHCKMRTYQCKECPAAFNYKSQLRAHARVHTDGSDEQHCPFQSLPLPLHDQSTTSAVASARLILVSTVGGSSLGRACVFLCSLCSYSALSVNLLRCHMRSTHGYLEDPAGGFRCVACSAVFPSFDAVKVHSCPGTEKISAGCSATEHCLPGPMPSTDLGSTSATMKCEQCDFVALSARSLKSHLKRHLNDKRYVEQPLEQYKCNMCGYVCHHLPSLKSHMWRHASDKEYSYHSANAAINAAIDHDAGVRKASVTRSYDEPNETRGENNPTFVAFRCCHCGFETVDKASLNAHTKEHSDVIIRKTLSVVVDVHS